MDDQAEPSAETVRQHPLWPPIERRITKALQGQDDATLERVLRTVATAVLELPDLLRPDGPVTDWARELVDDPSAEPPRRGAKKKSKA